MNSIKKFLIKSGIIDQLKWSRAYRFYFRLKNPLFANQLEKEYQLHRQFLGADVKLIYDIGANAGYKTEVFLRFGGRVIAIEPDKRNLNVLKIRYQHNQQVSIVPKAVGEKVGKLPFFMLVESHGLNTLSKKQLNILQTGTSGRWQPLKMSSEYDVSVTTLSMLIEEYGLPDYIKIDVEGFEKNVLEGLNTKIPYISFECNLPEFLEESMWCLRHLQGISDKILFNYSDNDENFGLPKFVPLPIFEKWIKETSLRYIEIFCKL
jgi:FkbM family methyltransferase